MPADDRSPGHTLPLLIEGTAEGVRTLTLNRPAKRNALDTTLIDLLHRALDEAESAGDVAALLLAGAGPMFCAGADLGEFKGAGEDATPALQRRTERSAGLLARVTDFPKPVVAAVHGGAIGAGAALALACDFTVFGEGARLSYPEVRHGMVGAIVQANLAGQLGYRRAFELLALGEPLSASVAAAWGLVNRVVPDAQLETEALAVARRLAAIDPAVIRETKALLRRGSESSLAAALADGVQWSRRRRGL